MTNDLMKFIGDQILEDEGAMISAQNQGDWNRYHRLEGHKMAMLKVRQKIVELDAAKFSESMDRTLIARKAILEDLKVRFKNGDSSVKANDPDFHWHKPQTNYYSGAGQMDCPVCKTGKLRYSRSSYNGHVHGACLTDGCVRWVE